MLCKDDLPWKSALSDSLGITWRKLNCFVSIAFGVNPVGGPLAYLWFYFVASLVLVSGCVEPGLLGLQRLHGSPNSWKSSSEVPRCPQFPAAVTRPSGIFNTCFNVDDVNPSEFR